MATARVVVFARTAARVPPPSVAAPMNQSSANVPSEVIDLISDGDDDPCCAEKEGLPNATAIPGVLGRAVDDIVVIDDEGDDEDALDRCVVCDVDLNHFAEAEKERHMLMCLDQNASSKSSGSIRKDSLSYTASVGLRLHSFFCVLCDLDLSRRKLLSRCSHLKRCARENRMSTKQLLSLIAPVREEELDVDGELDNEVAPSAPPKNAWSVLMSNSKKQSQLAGFHPTANASTGSSSALRKRPASVGPTFAGASSSSQPPQLAKRKSWSAVSQKVTGAVEGVAGYAPAYKKIQLGSMSVPIVVDGFQFASAALSDCYILTHFHSDHYQGLGRAFDCGKIYCSRVTASLAQAKLKVPVQHLVVLELETKYVLAIGGQDVEVTLLDANHCPGAVCVWLHFPSLRRHVLHTGDFRYDAARMLRTSPALRALAQDGRERVNQSLTVYLDTTYCDATYTFPSQQAVIDAVVKAMRQEVLQEGTLLVFGAYTIGKERLFMSTAKALGAKVFVDKTRWKTMLCLDWPIEDQAILTTDSSSASIWVVGMDQVSFNALPALLAKAGPQFRRVVGVQPTGWTHSSKGSSPSLSSSGVSVRRKGDALIYAAPYSEHSSFSELLDFVQTFKPFMIVPTVNTRQDKVQEQLKLLRQASRVYDEGG